MVQFIGYLIGIFMWVCIGHYIITQMKINFERKSLEAKIDNYNNQQPWK